MSETQSEYTQLCVWPGTVVGEKREEFVNFIQDWFGVRARYEAEVTTGPSRDPETGMPVADTGGRNDLFFYIHSADIPKFALARLAYGIHWWEDVVLNGQAYLYPLEFVEAHPSAWNGSNSASESDIH